MASKVSEALDHVKEAEKALKTGLFKWNPDYDTAASEYTKAATCFKLGNSPEKCKEVCSLFMKVVWDVAVGELGHVLVD